MADIGAAMGGKYSTQAAVFKYTRNLPLMRDLYIPLLM